MSNNGHHRTIDYESLESAIKEYTKVRPHLQSYQKRESSKYLRGIIRAHLKTDDERQLDPWWLFETQSDKHGPQTWFISDEQRINRWKEEQKRIVDSLCSQIDAMIDDIGPAWDEIEAEIKKLVDPAYEQYDRQTEDAVTLIEDFAASSIDNLAMPIISQILPLLDETEHILLIRKGKFTKANIECVYVIFGPMGILYIGQTQNVRVRMYQHRTQTLCGLAWLGAICVKTHRRLDLEKILIRILNPPLNVNHVIPEDQMFMDDLFREDVYR